MWASLPVGFAQKTEQTITLNGTLLTLKQLMQIVHDGVEVMPSTKAKARVRASHALLLKAADQGIPIYGITTGVGKNKSQKVSRDIRKSFNAALVYAHAAGVGMPIAPKVVRAMMVLRLNAMLSGSTGVRPVVVEILTKMLNAHLTPIMPSVGSIGEGDININVALARAMMGKGEMLLKSGKKIAAWQALKDHGISLLKPTDKDVLSIMSNNIYSEALTAFILTELEQIVKISQLIFCLSLEGLNGNITPFLKHTNQSRPIAVANQTSKAFRQILKGSYLWDQWSFAGNSPQVPNPVYKTRPLQDPLSYRTMAYVLGNLINTQHALQQQWEYQIKASSDNPVVILDAQTKANQYSEKRWYVAVGDTVGAVIPSANFSQIILSNQLQTTAIALSHLSWASANRMVKLSSPEFTGLPLFLKNENDSSFHAFGAIQKIFVALATKNQALAAPISMYTLPIAGDIEDMASNAPLIAQRVLKSIDNLYYILAIELMHASQAVDLRAKIQNLQQKEKRQLPKGQHFKLAARTQFFLKAFRKVVKFREKDAGALSVEIEKAYNFLKKYLR